MFHTVLNVYLCKTMLYMVIPVLDEFKRFKRCITVQKVHVMLVQCQKSSRGGGNSSIISYLLWTFTMLYSKINDQSLAAKRCVSKLGWFVITIAVLDDHVFAFGKFNSYVCIQNENLHLMNHDE